jgi:hypothetical protein
LLHHLGAGNFQTASESPELALTACESSELIALMAINLQEENQPPAASQQQRVFINNMKYCKLQYWWW